MSLKKLGVIYLFDEIGDRFEVENIHAILEQLLDEDLEIMYKSTKYMYELELAKIELIDLKIMQQAKGEIYDADGIMRGVNHLKGEILKRPRMGEKLLSKLDSEIDLSWKENKPDFSKYKK